ncbi:unnamed protein product [Rhizoctonia solani]|uniref:G domain-containing protein n=1 Tax=Rhizoctonia solani TaxID=456999 RepID=A0A8H3CPN2_9AGAM|nr:unnamed protein product [Rhizoctonia solani]
MMNLNRESSQAPEALNHAAPVAPEAHTEDPNVILLFGCTGTGKTSFANIASGSDMEVGKGIRSATKHLEASKVFRVDDQPVVVVDCPGFNDTYLTETEILRRLAEYLTKAYETRSKIAGLLYMHKISDTRVGGASFRHMKMFEALCGDNALKNAVYVTNMWSVPPTEDETLREKELRDTNEFFGGPLTKGAQIARHHNTRESAHSIIRMILGKGHVITRLQHQLLKENIPLEETDVGLVIGRDLEDDLFKQQQEMEQLKAEKEKAMTANDENWLRRLEAQQARTKKAEQRLVDQLRVLKANKPDQLNNTSQQSRVARGKLIDSSLTSLRAQMEAKMNEFTQNAKQHDSMLNASSRQSKWDEERNEKNRRELDSIQEARNAHSRRRAAERNAIAGFVSSASSTLRECAAFFQREERNRGASRAAIEDAQRLVTYPPARHEPLTEDISKSYGARDPNRDVTSDTSEMKHHQRQNSSGSQFYPPDRNKNTSDGREGHAIKPTDSSQSYGTSEGPRQRSPPPDHETDTTWGIM